MTIGAVCKGLQQEFPDISISKLRYLEDQKLLTPRRTPGGYRLYSPGTWPGCGRSCASSATSSSRCASSARSWRPAAEREPAVAVTRAAPPAEPATEPRRRWRPTVSVTEAAAFYTIDDVIEETQADPKLVRELEEYGVIKGVQRDGVKYFDDTEREIIRAVTELARYGVGGRNLRVFRSSADREASLLQQILEPALRSRNPQRRKEAVEALENLAVVATHLKHLLLIRDLRKIAN